MLDLLGLSISKTIECSAKDVNLDREDKWYPKCAEKIETYLPTFLTVSCRAHRVDMIMAFGCMGCRSESYYHLSKFTLNDSLWPCPLLENDLHHYIVSISNKEQNDANFRVQIDIFVHGHLNIWVKVGLDNFTHGSNLVKYIWCLPGYPFIVLWIWVCTLCISMLLRLDSSFMGSLIKHNLFQLP